MFTSHALNNKCFRQITHARLWKNVILWAIFWREISPLVVIFKKKLIKLHRGLLDVTTNIYLKSCAYHPDSECCTFFHGNLSDPKSSEDTLLYLYVIWNMLKSADLHETILTPVICHKHVRCHDWCYPAERIRLNAKRIAKYKKKKPERFLSKVLKHPYCHMEIFYTGFMPSWFSISFRAILQLSREIGDNGRLLREPEYNLPSFGNTIIDSRSLPLAYSHYMYFMKYTPCIS